MIALSNWNQLDRVADETGMETWQLHAPKPGYRVVDESAPFAVDNRAYSGFDSDAFSTTLARLSPHKARCRFVACPDIVGDAVGTRELWDDRKTLFPFLAGWPLAFVAQDGCQGRVPWYALPRGRAALFVGGAGGWKESAECEHVVRQAKIRGLWVHVGRLNDRDRLLRFLRLGADSFDGMALTGRGREDQRLRLRATYRQWCGDADAAQHELDFSPPVALAARPPCPPAT